jgi:Cu/Ag efflux pump CusA
MLISHIKHLRAVEGESDLCTAVIRGTCEPVAPILMTALAAGLAMIPIADGMGKPDSEIQAPMAIVILFGLMSSALPNMVVVLAVYYAAGSRDLKIAR